nr:putative lipopolysaccharide heptosyltransferase III [Simkania negevensis]
MQRVLVAKLRHHGDVLLSAPVFSVLKKYYPHLEVDAYIYSETLPMLEGHPAISKFVLYDKKWKKLAKHRRFLEEWKLLKEIRRGSYDLVINLTEGDRGAVAAKVSRAPYAIGFDPQGSGMMQKEKCYTHLIKHTPKPRHTVEKQLDALRCLGLHPKEEERDLFFHIPEEARLRVETLLHENGVDEGQFIQVHPVSRWMFKTLPVKTIVEVLHFLHDQGKQIVLTASPDPLERKMNKEIVSLAPFAIDLSGQISLKELGAMIKMSQMLLSVDSVPMHLASALKKPTVAIFGPTCEQNWGPWRNPGARVVTQKLSCRPCYQPGCGGSGKSDCLTTLSSQSIIQAVEEVLEFKVLSKVGCLSSLVSEEL